MAVTAGFILLYSTSMSLMSLVMIFPNEGIVPWMHPVGIIYFLFCIQLFVQFIYVFKQINNKGDRVRRLIAIALTVFVPIVLTIITVMVIHDPTIGTGPDANQSMYFIDWVVLGIVLLTHVAGSAWLWVLIRKAKSTKSALKTAPEEEPQLIKNFKDTPWTHKNIKTIALAVSASLLVTGALFLQVSTHTPVFRDATEYDKTYSQITSDYEGNKISSSKASDRFYQNQVDNMSNKYSLESAGWSFIIASAYTAVYACWFMYVNRNQRLPHKAWLYVLTLSNVLLSLGLFVVSIFVDYNRMRFPYWADSLGIPLFSTALVSPLILGFTVAITAVVSTSYTRTPSTLKFGLLPISYKIYFVITSIILGVLLVELIRHPDYTSMPFLAGSILFNYLIFVGISRTRPHKTKAVKSTVLGV